VDPDDVSCASLVLCVLCSCMCVYIMRLCFTNAHNHIRWNMDPIYPDSQFTKLQMTVVLG